MCSHLGICVALLLGMLWTVILPDVLVPTIHGSSDLGLVPLAYCEPFANSLVSRDSASCDHGLGALSISPLSMGTMYECVASNNYFGRSMILSVGCCWMMNAFDHVHHIGRLYLGFGIHGNVFGAFNWDLVWYGLCHASNVSLICRRAMHDVGDAVKPFFAAVTVLPLVFDTHLGCTWIPPWPRRTTLLILSCL
ncbi:hypothetical protein Nepgr_012463 [Nepenthes gracilis]|uniref:Transmembrane protein n=1 Tax=Nepenthes gracilis TaxID=150966 RepID=A0AAD3SHC3_NEPGR|nr:hypothetical protein Nepgr_012463 [Nepenthes gracilis]